MSHGGEAVHHGHGGHDEHEAWGTSVWPFVISFGVLALSVAFMLQFVYHKPFAAVIALGLGIPMILGGVARFLWARIPAVTALAAVALLLGMIGVMLVFTDLMVRGLYAQVDAAKARDEESGKASGETGDD